MIEYMRYLRSIGVLIACYLLSCNSKQGQSVPEQGLAPLNMSRKYKSDPISCDTLGNEDLGVGEFRVTLPQHFTEEELTSREIKVLEYTWKRNDKLGGYTTVWYELRADSSLRYLESISYDEFVEF